MVISPVTLTGRARLGLWILFLMISVVFVGFRHEIGGDWENYLEWTRRIGGETIGKALDGKDPGYALINWLSSRIGWGIYGVNVFCAGVLIGALTFFCSRQPLPGLSLVVAIPYLVIVVGMGYTRQSVALAFFLVALVFLQEKRIWLYLGLLIIGAMFHTSVILLLVLVFLWLDKNSIREIAERIFTKRQLFVPAMMATTVIVGIIGILVTKNYQMFESQISSYIFGDDWESKGGLTRALMNAGPALFLLVRKRVWGEVFGNFRIWYSLALMAILSIPMTMVASTLTDRVGLYLLPLQIYFFSRFPLLFRDGAVRSGAILMVCILYGLVLWVWLEYANHAYYWVPYDNLLFR